MSDSQLLQLANERVVVFDGAMGTSLQLHDLPLSDYHGHENLSEILVLTRPDVIRGIHRSFLSVGCDAVLTNTFGANRIVLAEFGLSEEACEINKRAVLLAREACDGLGKPGSPKFVIGSVGPGTRLPSLNQTSWDELAGSYTQQVCGLLDGGVDAVLIETCQDILQAKAAVVGAIDALDLRGLDIPIFCTVTVESSGTMLVGTDIAAAVVALEAYDQVMGLGVNCATGPEEMSEHVRHLSGHCDRLLIVQPNAGLPQVVDGKPRYSLTPPKLADWLVEFVEKDGVNIVGGCCGTTPEHLGAVVDAVAGKRPKRRQVRSEPSVSSLYQAVTIRQDTDCLAIGERTNANGSKKFREQLNAEDLEGMVQTAREQVERNHLLDICTACVGRDEVADMSSLVRRLATEITLPLVIDSTEPAVLEAALKLAGGKCVINSINLEGGEGRLADMCALAKRYGAALIALTIDEKGMARTADDKVRIARRIYDLATSSHGVSPSDLIFDPLTFTICTGNKEDDGLALETLDALERIKDVCPGSHTVLGVSNVSFGVAPPIRRVLNSVFLHHARQRGLNAAIMHMSGILPLYRIDEAHRRLAEDLIFDRHDGEYDPLQELLATCKTDTPLEDRKGDSPSTVEERIKRRIIDGNRRDIEIDLEEAMLSHPPLEIINEILLDGMKTVGDLFGAGQMQLPFVLRSAETMKAAVDHLEPHMDHEGGNAKGTIVLATVRGDVHDIGKNLVDIIMTNNGYRVVNLGIKQPINNIINACREHSADAIGLSGLLVKSTLVMKENLQVLTDHHIKTPVILGGAALTRKYVEHDLRLDYAGPLFYARNAFEGLAHMASIVTGRASTTATADSAVRCVAAGTSGTETVSGLHEASITGNPDSTDDWHLGPEATGLDDPARRRSCTPPRSDISRSEPVPEPPFWGSKVIERIDPPEVLPFLNETMLFQVQWQYHRNRRRREEFEEFVNREVRPILDELFIRCAEDKILDLQAIYGYWPAQSEGDNLIIYDPDDHTRRIETFEFPRMGKPPYWCLGDFFRPVSGGVMDVVAFSVVTAGGMASKVSREWFEADRYRDYLHLHGLSVELAEACAEYIHKRVRTEWGIAAHDAPDNRELLKQRYQGSRYSFGYAACPRIEDQLKLWPMLEPHRIGVSLTQEFQLEPEQTTTAVITHHRQAKYFNAR